MCLRVHTEIELMSELEIEVNLMTIDVSVVLIIKKMVKLSL